VVKVTPRVFTGVNASVIIYLMQNLKKTTMRCLLALGILSGSLALSQNVSASELTDTQAQLTQAQSEKTALQTKINSLTTSIAKMEKAVAKQQKEIEVVVLPNTGKTTKKTTPLVTVLPDTGGKAADVTPSLTTALQDHTEKAETLEANEKSLDNMEASLTAAKSALSESTARVANLQAQVDEIASHVDLAAGQKTQDADLVAKIFTKATTALKAKASGKVYGNGNAGTYAAGQCTYGVAEAAASVGVYVGNYWGNGGQWGRTAAAAGATVSSTPQVGAIVSIPGGTLGSSGAYGHVAIVGQVDESTQTAIIWEMNVYGRYEKSIRAFHYGVGETYIIP
jgi:surface antigen